MGLTGDMAINSDKPHLWKADIAASVDQFNSWFMQAAPKAYRDTRQRTTGEVLAAMRLTDNHRGIHAETLRAHPEVLATLRMSTSPPLAVDRLVGLASCNKTLVLGMERNHKISPRIARVDVARDLDRICDILGRLIDPDLFPWIGTTRKPAAAESGRAATVVADRLCGSLANPIIRNAQERRQLKLVGDFLKKRGYREKAHPSQEPVTAMEPGTYAFRLSLVAGGARKVKIPIDVVIQPKRLRPSRIPVLIEAKSAGDFTNTNKRRKEEATKIHQLQEAFGVDAQLVLFLCGYFDSGYLGYEAAEGIDWVWEHRINDLNQLGL